MSVKGLRSRPSSGLGPRARPRSSLFLPESGGSSPEDHHEVKGAAPGGGPSRVRDPLRLSCQLPLRGQLDRASLPLAKELEAKRRANRRVKQRASPIAPWHCKVGLGAPPKHSAPLLSITLKL